MKNPCYDLETQIDCPKRRVGCRKDCAEWKEYEEEQRKRYSDKLKTVKKSAITNDYYFDKTKKVKK